MSLITAVTLVEKIGNLIGTVTEFLSSGSDIEIVIKSILVAGVIAMSMVVGVALFISLTLNYGRVRIERSLSGDPQTRPKVADKSSYEFASLSRKRRPLNLRLRWKRRRRPTRRAARPAWVDEKTYLSRRGDLRLYLRGE